jgi:hypothetical protein
MTNCLKPFAITFAGIVVDYKLAITVRNNLQANLRQFVQFMFLQMFRIAYNGLIKIFTWSWL